MPPRSKIKSFLFFLESLCLLPVLVPGFTLKMGKCLGILELVTQMMQQRSFLPPSYHILYSSGLLKVGVPKKWDDSKKDLGYIRNAGVRQFISTYNRVKDLRGDELLWGDEIEYGIFHIDPETNKVRLSLRAKEVSSDVEIRFGSPRMYDSSQSASRLL